ncbi:hypothetical protein OC842_002704 [Tilletia horrida]|uniref:Uncharacterized protein n=1 Tax=Tilletia horrida TaxID=155126 RepID=A0AAN6GD66_9BASI|nr:hypothetical protein OC842_002704 [Tilletia horrida]
MDYHSAYSEGGAAPYADASQSAAAGAGAGAAAGGGPPASAIPTSRLPLHINVSSPMAVPVTAQSYIPGPGPMIPPIAPEHAAGIHEPTAAPLLAALGPAQAAGGPHCQQQPPYGAADSLGAPPSHESLLGASGPPAPVPAPSNTGAEAHSFDDCPACRAEYAAAVAASLKADVERQHADAERERKELEDAIRLSEQEDQAGGAAAEDAEEEMIRRAIEESTRNAAEEEERRKQWRQALQHTLGEGSSLSASASTANPEALDEEEVLRRVMEESAKAEQEARKRREEADALEANILERSRRTAELAEQQRYLELQEASMWRSPDANSAVSGSGKARERAHGSSPAPTSAGPAAAGESMQSGAGPAAGTEADWTQGDPDHKSKEDEDYSLGLGLRASRRSQEIPAGMGQEDFARAIADEVRNRMDRRPHAQQEHLGPDSEPSARPARSQAEEDSFWRRPDAVAPDPAKEAVDAQQPRVTALPAASSAANIARLAQAAATGSGENSSQSVSIPPVQFGEAVEGGMAGGRDSDGRPDVPESVSGSLPPPFSAQEELGKGPELSTGVAHPKEMPLLSAAEEVDTKAPASFHGMEAIAEACAPPASLPPSQVLPSTHPTLSPSNAPAILAPGPAAPRPLPVPPGPPPPGSIPAHLASIPALAPLRGQDSVDSTLAEQLRSAAMLESHLTSARSEAATPVPGSVHTAMGTEVASAAQAPVAPGTSTGRVHSHGAPPNWSETEVGPAQLEPEAESEPEPEPQSTVPQTPISVVEPDLPRHHADAPIDVDADSLAESYATSPISADMRRGESTASGGPGPASTAGKGAARGESDGKHLAAPTSDAPPPLPPSYAVPNPDPDTTVPSQSHQTDSLGGPAVMSNFGSSSLDSVSLRRPGSVSGSGSGSTADPLMLELSGSGASSAPAAAAEGRRSMGATPLFATGQSGVGANPLLASLTYSHNTPAAALPSAAAAAPSNGVGPHRERWSSGSISVMGGGHALVQSGSAIQPAGGAGRWSGEPQIALSLRRSSAAVSSGFGVGSGSSVSSHSPSHHGSISGAVGGSAVSKARSSFSSGTTTFSNASPPSSAVPTFNPLFSAFGADAEDASRTASAAAANAPLVALPREHHGGWAGAQAAPHFNPLQTPPQPSPYAMASGNAAPHFSPISAHTSPSAGASGTPVPAPSTPALNTIAATATAVSAGAMPSTPSTTSPEASGSMNGTGTANDSGSSGGTAGKTKKKLKSLFSRHDRSSSKASNHRMSLSLMSLSLGRSGSGNGNGSENGLETVGVPYDATQQQQQQQQPPPSASAAPDATGTSQPHAQTQAQPWVMNPRAAGSRASLGSAFSSAGPTAAASTSGAAGLASGVVGGAGGSYASHLSPGQAPGRGSVSIRSSRSGGNVGRVEESVEELRDSAAALR